MTREPPRPAQNVEKMSKGQLAYRLGTYTNYLNMPASRTRDVGLHAMHKDPALPRIAAIPDGQGSYLLHHACRNHAIVSIEKVLEAWPRAASMVTRCHPAKPARWTPLHCLCDTQVQHVVGNELLLARIANKLLHHMPRVAIMHATQQTQATFLHMLSSRGRWHFLDAVLWPMWGGQRTVTREDVKDMLNATNRNGLACVDLSLKGESGQAQWLSHYFHAKNAKPNLKNPPGFVKRTAMGTLWVGWQRLA